jgi:hypothetical protein
MRGFRCLREDGPASALLPQPGRRLKIHPDKSDKSRICGLASSAQRLAKRLRSKESINMAPGGMNRVTDKRLGQILLESDRISPEQLEASLAYSAEHKVRLGTALARLGHVTNDHIYWALGIQFGVTKVEIAPEMIDRKLIARFPPDVLIDNSLLPLIDAGDEMVVLTSDPFVGDGLRVLQKLCPNLPIRLELASKRQIQEALRSVFPDWRERDSTGAATGVDSYARAPQPQSFASPAGMTWLLTQALAADGELMIMRKGESGQALVVTESSQEILSEFSRADFEAIYRLISETVSHLTPSTTGFGFLPGMLQFQDKTYLISTATLASLGATGLRLRPLRVSVPPADTIEEYTLTDSQQQAIASRVEAANGRLTLIVTEPSANWNSILYHTVRALNWRHPNLLFVSASARFALPDVLQYPAEATQSFRNLAALAAQSRSSHVVLESPFCFDDCQAIRSGYPSAWGLTVLYRVIPRDAGGLLPPSFWDLLEGNRNSVVMWARDGVMEAIDGAQAKSTLSDWR